jgi:PPK2 family polyphosphate:nucleotide phosphotransferase
VGMSELYFTRTSGQHQYCDLSTRGASYEKGVAMKTDHLIKKARSLSRPYAVTKPDKFRLKDVDPSDTGDLDNEDKTKAKEALADGVKVLAECQDILYAHDHWSVLLIFQAMDAAGKDGAIKHVMSGINPQGCQVASFKVPSTEELDHDFLWRCQKHLPERGRIGIFNRSYYEDVLVVKVHPELLEKQKLAPALRGKHVWDTRYKDIRNFEQYLANNGTIVRKFFLHVSRDEQKKRFLERIEDPAKNWKFSAGDIAERQHWDDYMDAYQTMIRKTSTENCPWYVIPADNKWYTRIVVAAAVIDALSSLGLHYPKVTAAQREALAQSRTALQNED